LPSFLRGSGSVSRFIAGTLSNAFKSSLDAPENAVLAFPGISAAFLNPPKDHFEGLYGWN
jgi:hypothetical protein